MRAEITVFVISPRNSTPAVTHLLSKIQPSHILVSLDTPMQELARNAINTLHVHIPIVLPMLVYEEIFIPGMAHIPLLPRRRDLSAARIIAHSSGMCLYLCFCYMTFNKSYRHDVISKTNYLE